MERLASELRGIRSGDVTFATVPLASLTYMTPTGQSAVLWNASAARSLFRQLKKDQVPVKAPRHPGLRRRPVPVDVYNGTLIGGLSALTGNELSALHFHVHSSGLTWPSQNVAQTVIGYPARMKAAARLILRVMPGAVLHRVRGLPRLRIVLGRSGYQITAPVPAASGSGSATGGARTAAQAACK